MKKVIFVRHAKSSWAEPNLRDIERPLNKRGQRDAPFMAELMRRKGEVPDLMISSPAVRAKSTALYFAEEFQIPADHIIIDERIYHAFPADVLQIVQAQEDDMNKMYVFGHNPTFTSVANMFTEEYIDNIPTCGIFEVSADVSEWQEFTPETAGLRSFHYPKQYFKK